MLRRDSRHFDQIGSGFPVAAQAITRNGPSPAATAIKGPAAERERQSLMSGRPGTSATRDRSRQRSSRSRPSAMGAPVRPARLIETWPLVPQIQRDAIDRSCLLGSEDRPSQRSCDVREGTFPLGEHLEATQIALGPPPLRRTQRDAQPGRFLLRRVQTAAQCACNGSRRHLLLRQSSETAYFFLSPGALFRTF